MAQTRLIAAGLERHSLAFLHSISGKKSFPEGSLRPTMHADTHS